MVPKQLRVGAIIAVLAATGFAWGERQAAAREPRVVLGGTLFHNYYVPPDPYWGLGSQLYICPRPTPPWVGHTFITYEPLMPHEFLYQHHRVYYRENPGVGITRVHVSWGKSLLP